MNPKSKFCSGERVFAKVKGYPYWPAVVQSIASKENAKLQKYNVTFYGTNEVAIVKQTDLCSYLENKSKHGQPKLQNFRNERFNRAIKEAEASFYSSPSTKRKTSIAKFDSSLPKSQEEIPYSPLKHFPLTASSPGVLNSPSLLRDQEGLKEAEVSFNNEVSTASNHQPSPKGLHHSSVTTSTPLSMTLSLGKSEAKEAIDKTSKSRVNLPHDKPPSCTVKANQDLLEDLLGPNWISDNTLWHYLELINDKLINKSNMTCLNPIICQAVKMLDDFAFLLEPLNLKTKKYILIPVNDCIEVSLNENTGGTHWSLLVYEKESSSFYHYDSVQNKNSDSAKAIANKCFKYLSDEPSRSTVFINRLTPQQNNSYDCGMYVILMAELILGNVLYNNKLVTLQDYMFLPSYTEYDLVTKRSQVAYAIHNKSHIATDLLLAIFKNTSLDSMTVSQQAEVDNFGNKEEEYGSGAQKPIEKCKPNKKEKISKDRRAYQSPQQQYKVQTFNKFEILSTLTTDDKQPLTSNIHLDNRNNEKKNKEIKSNQNYRQNKIKKEQKYQQPYKKSQNTKNHTANRPSRNINTSPDDSKTFCTKNNTRKKKDICHTNITIYCDSMGRHLSQLVGDQLDNTKVIGICKPGAKYEHVVKGLKEDDSKTCTVIIAGTNDAASGNIGSVFDSLKQCLRQNTNSTFLIATIPQRYDLPYWHYVNSKVYEANQYIYEIVSRTNNAHILNLSNLRRHHSTRHGFHLNFSGKRTVSRMIITKLEDICLLQKSSTLKTNQNMDESLTTTPSAPRIVPGELTYAEMSKRIEVCEVIKKSRVTSVSEPSAEKSVFRVEDDSGCDQHLESSELNNVNFGRSTFLDQNQPQQVPM